jgi:hypothetical protein
VLEAVAGDGNDLLGRNRRDSAFELVGDDGDARTRHQLRELAGVVEAEPAEPLAEVQYRAGGRQLVA